MVQCKHNFYAFWETKIFIWLSFLHYLLYFSGLELNPCYLLDMPMVWPLIHLYHHFLSLPCILSSRGGDIFAHLAHVSSGLISWGLVTPSVFPCQALTHPSDSAEGSSDLRKLALFFEVELPFCAFQTPPKHPPLWTQHTGSWVPQKEGLCLVIS